MNSWWRWLLGLEEGELPAGSEARWELSGLPQGGLLFLWVLIVAGSAALIVLLYRSERALRLYQKVSLTALRLAALALVLLALLNPRLLTEIHFTRPGRTLLFFDVSSSMGQRDDFESEEIGLLEAATGLDLGARPTRAELAVGALREQDFVRRLEDNNRVDLYAFAADVRLLPQLEGVEDVSPTGSETRIGDALGTVLRDVGRDPLAGVVVLSDGRNTGGKTTREASRELAARRRVPVHAVGIGRALVPKNCAVRELKAPRVVEVGYPVAIEGKVTVSGLRDPVRVILERRMTRGGSGTKVVESRQIDPGSLRFEARLKFIDKLSRKGDYRYVLKIPRREGEIRGNDNEREAFVRAAEQEYRVLLLAGNSLPEFRFLRNFTIRDDGILVSSWQTSADRASFQDGDMPIHAVPETADDLSEYDVVILIDPEPDFITPVFLEGLKDFVAEQGGGLVYVSSEANTPSIAAGARFRTLRALLPVDLVGRRDPRGQIHDRPWRPRLTAAGDEHPLCRVVEDPAENRKLWRYLPPLYYAHSCGRLGPAAVALLVSDRDTVVAAVQRVGLGETLYLGSDGFWRWRAAGVEYHERFWAGVIRYLAMGKKYAGTRQISVETDRDFYRQGEPVRITVQLVDAQRRPVEAPRVDVTVEQTTDAAGMPAGASSVVEASAGSSGAEARAKWLVGLNPVEADPGRFSGLFRPPAAGHFRVYLEPRGEARFEVRRLTTEWEDPSPDFAGLEELAVESGGSFVTLEGLEDVAGRIPDSSVTEVLGRRAATVWDSAALMILFCAFLAVEWVLRKLWRLN